MNESFHVAHQEGRDLRIHDPALGYDYTVAARGPDALMYNVLTTPIARRSLDVCQLSKSAVDDTISGLEGMRRYQHICGIYETVRHFNSLNGIDPKRATRYALGSTLGDMAHGVKSHATDIMIEGVGGKEEFHDSRVDQVIAYGGLQEVFDKHGIRVTSRSLGRSLPNWVENSNKEPCVDNVNYIAGESRIWFPGNEVVTAATSLDALTINENGQFVFRDQDTARIWGKLGLLLSSEHWNDPPNRLILLIGVETLKRTIFRRYLEDIDEVDNGNLSNPEDYTFFCDKDFDVALEKNALDNHHQDGFMTAAYLMLQTLGYTERVRYATHKKKVYEEFLSDHKALEYPSSYINPHIAKFGPQAVFVEVLGQEDKDRAESIEGRGRLLSEAGKPIGYLKNFKKRQYEPLVYDSHGNTVRLSDVDPIYKGLVEQQGRAITYTEAMRLLMNRESEETFCAALADNVKAMDEARRNHRPLSPDQLRRVIKGAGTRATNLAISKGMWQEV